MQQFVIQLILLAIGFGLLVGLLVLAVIALTQGRQRVDSLIQLSELVGQSAIVEVPCDRLHSGKVRVKYQSQTLQLVAKTDAGGCLQPGDIVMIFEIQQTVAWVMLLSNIYP